MKTLSAASKSDEQTKYMIVIQGDISKIIPYDKKNLSSKKGGSSKFNNFNRKKETEIL